MLTRKIVPDSLLRAAGLGLSGLVLLLGGCASERAASRYSQTHDGAPGQRIDVASIKDAVPRVEPLSRYGNPSSYVVRGTRYYTLNDSKNYRARGIASWYGTKFHGHRTSSGDTYDMYTMSAAHKTLPLPTYARVTNLGNGKSVVVKINDRGPFHDNRLIDLSYAAAARLDILGSGTGQVEVVAIDPTGSGQSPRIAPSRPKIATAAPAAVPATVAATIPAPSTHQPQLYLQLGAFRSRDNAQRLQSRLRDVDLPGGLQISEVNRDNQRVYRVRVGPLASVETADELTRQLIDHGIPAPRIVID